MTHPTSLPPSSLPLSAPFRTAALSSRKPARFDLKPDAATRAQIAQVLDITAVRDLRFKGEITPHGRHDFDLRGFLSATVEQPCAVTLVPVLTKIDEPVVRRYIADMMLPDGDEIEMPEDDTAEPLPDTIDAGAVAIEALALALPLYPRADGAELPETVIAPPGVAPLRDADLRPFAGLAALAGKLAAPDADDAS